MYEVMSCRGGVMAIPQKIQIDIKTPFVRKPCVDFVGWLDKSLKLNEIMWIFQKLAYV